MRDRALERRIAEVQELIDLWGNFHEMMVAVVKGAGFTDEHDREFLNVKSTIARKFQAISDKFEKRTFPEEEVTEVLSQAVSLEQIKKMSSFTTSQFENTWHRVLIEFNRVLGHIESERDSLARVSLLGIKAKRLFRNKLFIFLVVVAVILAGIYAAHDIMRSLPNTGEEKIEQGTESVEAEAEAEEEEGTFRKFYEKVLALMGVVKEKIVRGENNQEE